jgi:hypothetical protein
MKKFLFWNCVSLAYGTTIGFGGYSILEGEGCESLLRLGVGLANAFFIFAPFLIFALLLIGRARSLNNDRK